MVLKHRRDGLQIIFRRHVTHRPIFVVEILGGVGAGPVACDQMFEHFPVAGHVVAKVHRHEPAELQEAGIDLAAMPWIDRRNRRDDILFKPRERSLGGECVDRRRGFAGIDRPAHHRERGGEGRVVRRRHQRYGGIGRDRWLADGEHVRTWADMLQEFHQIVDIIIKVEAAVFGRGIFRVAPVSDPDVVRWQQSLDRAAQQRGEMAGHRCHDQHTGVASCNTIADKMF